MFDICTHDLSHLFWSRLLRLQAWNVDRAIAIALNHGAICELDRDMMEYKTGSIPLATAVWLYLLAEHVKPQIVFEVGTFIGKSTLALGEAMNGGRIWTCDASNEAPECLTSEAIEASTIIEPHPKMTSTQMFAPIEDDKKADLFFFDGRIMDEDMAHIARLSKPETIYAFDDFEGTEKGTINVAKLRSGLRSDCMLIVPPMIEIAGVHDRSTLALLVPSSLFRMTAQ